MHFTTRNHFHYGQWFQQKRAAPTKNGFHRKEWLPLQILFSPQEMFSRKGMTSTKRISLDEKEWLLVKGMASIRMNGFY